MTASTFPFSATDTTPRFVLDLAIALQKVTPYRITMLAPHAPGAAFHEELEGVEVYRFPYAFPSSLEKISGNGMFTAVKKNKLLWLLVPFFFLFQLLYTIRLIHKLKPALLVANWMVPQGLLGAFLKCFYRRLRLVIICRGRGVAMLSTKYTRPLGRFVMRHTDATVPLTDKLQREIETLAAEGAYFHPLPVAINTDFFAPLKQTRESTLDTLGHTALFIGRFDEKKGLVYLVRAMKTVLETLPDAVLEIVGDGPQRAEIEAEVKALDLEDKITFHGALPKSDMAPILARAALVCVPSIDLKDDREGVTNVVLESASAFLPLVVTDAGSITDFALHEQTALVSEQRSPESLAVNILRLLQDLPLRRILAQNAYIKVMAERSYDSVAQHYQVLFDKLLNKN